MLAHAARRLGVVGSVCALVALLATACSSHSEGAPDQAGADLSAAAKAKATTDAPALTDAQLAAELATPPPKPSTADLAKLVNDTVNQVATTARLKLLNDFIAAGIKKVDPKNDDQPYASLAFDMEGIFWATPRDLTSSPAGFGGQELTTKITLDDGGVGPTKITIRGVASAAYKLDLTIAGAHVKVSVPSGADAEAAAKAISDAISASNAAIMKTIGDEKAFAPIGGSHADSLSGVDDLEVSDDGATVSILVAMNG